jgi:hypothetical protein
MRKLKGGKSVNLNACSQLGIYLPVHMILFRNLRLHGAGVAQSILWLGYGLGYPGPFPGRGGKGFRFFVTATRPALGPTQPPYHEFQKS